MLPNMIGCHNTFFFFYSTSIRDTIACGKGRGNDLVCSTTKCKNGDCVVKQVTMQYTKADKVFVFL